MTELDLGELKALYSLASGCASLVWAPIVHKLGHMIAERGPPTIAFELPLRLASLVNRTEHWSKHAKRAKEQRGLTCAAVRGRWHRGPPGDATIARVRITRLGRGTLDFDGLVISAKHVVDGVADAFSMDDRVLPVAYAQEKQKAWGVRVEIWGG